MFEPIDAVQDLDVPHHGGLKRKELKKFGLSVDEVIDFSASLNPFGPPDFILSYIEEVSENDIFHYPEREPNKFVSDISNLYDVKRENVVVSAGVSELIDLIGKAFIDEEKSVLVPEFTYGEYEPVSKLNGGNLKTIRMPDLKLEANRFINKIEENSVVFICNPNNPTGDLLSKTELNRILEAVKSKDSLLVLDEAYLQFNSVNVDLSDSLDSNLILMKSITKIFGIPGIRIGYGLTSPELKRDLLKVKVPWSVSGLASKISANLFKEEGLSFIDRSRKKINKNKQWIKTRLGRTKFDYIDSETNFILIDVENASKVRKKLLKKGVIVRDCSSFGLPNFIRIGIRRKEENKKLIDALRSI
ncbi:MAG: Histidinol-phosphate/aromatic aminotransferase [Candidatus Methanohalarchaeum thermophilum]|uniref:Aminotransferase n=1 Tax=Methanohalarchaeum thermophilum TaxID=1903181 RepID=A0A1Q6DVP7_METT1|nr:MAG: Histidinol-phosphate/aromatic aminotransferase [Candidatus Methanohalarchaeum thermophilum]